MPAANISVRFALDGNSPSAQQFFDRLLTPPTTAREALYRTLIDSLVSAGVWALLDGLYVFAAADVFTAQVNLKSASYQAISMLHATSFAANAGYTPAGSSTILSFGFVPSAATGNFTRNSACIFAWNTSNVAAADLGLFNTSNVASAIFPYRADTTSRYAITAIGNTLTNAGSVAADPTGLWIANRTSASAVSLSRNGSVLHTATSASAALDANELVCASSNGFTLAFAGFGGGLDNTQLSALYSALNTYKTAVIG